MLAFARARGLPLACFGTVAGGWLSDRWLGVAAAPRGFAPPPGATVSMRMYAQPLARWSRGDWALFQELLRALRAVADRRGTTVANVAVAWVLRRLDDLGAGGWAIVGVRDDAHVAEHAALLRGEVALDDDDMASVAAVLDKGAAPVGDIWSHERGG